MDGRAAAVLSLAEVMEHTEPLFAGCPRPPQRVVCGNCRLGPEYRAVEHFAPVAEETVCLWPCRHEVQPPELACQVCEPGAPFNDGRPF